MKSCMWEGRSLPLPLLHQFLNGIHLLFTICQRTYDPPFLSCQTYGTCFITLRSPPVSLYLDWHPEQNIHSTSEDDSWEDWHHTHRLGPQIWFQGLRRLGEIRTSEHRGRRCGRREFTWRIWEYWKVDRRGVEEWKGWQERRRVSSLVSSLTSFVYVVVFVAFYVIYFPVFLGDNDRMFGNTVSVVE